MPPASLFHAVRRNEKGRRRLEVVVMVMVPDPYPVAAVHPMVIVPLVVAPRYPVSLCGGQGGRETPYGEPKG
jgi:hypothetical protein